MQTNSIQFDKIEPEEENTSVSFEPISFEPLDTTPSYEERDTSLLSKYNQFTRDMFTGATKEAERGFRNLGKLGNYVLSQTVGRGVNAISGKGFKPTETPAIYNNESQQYLDFIDKTTPEGMGQKLGATGYKIGEFLLGDKLTKPIAAAQTGYKALNVGLKALAGGASAGGVTTLQTGEYGKEAKINTMIGALIPVAAEGLKTLSSRINKAAIKPNSRDIEDGFNVENINKYKLGGNLQKMAQKTEDLMKKTSEELKDVLKASDETIDLNSTYYETYSKLKGNKFRLFGENKSIDRALTGLADELDNVLGVENGVNAYEANLIKQGAGTKGAWAFGRVDPDAAATEKVYSTFYSVLKKKIETAGGSEIVQSLNKKLGELIPIRSAIIRRIPVAERQNVISLSDSMYLFGALLDPRSLFLNLGTIATKSPTFANWLYKASTGSLKGVPSTLLKTGVSSGSVGLPGS